ncbi:MAG: sensor histidine kinase [Treponema socranskii subsp. buccale]
MKTIRNKLLILYIATSSVFFILTGTTSYFWTRKNIIDKVSESTIMSLSLIDQNIEAVLNSVHDISLFLIANNNVRAFLKLKEESQTEFALLRNMINDDLANLTAAQSGILSINVYGTNGFSNYESAGPSISDFARIAFTNIEIPDNGEAVLSSAYIRNYQALGKRYVISFYRKLRDPYALTRVHGLIRIDIDGQKLASLFIRQNHTSQAYGFICNKDGDITLHSDPNTSIHHLDKDGIYRRLFTGDVGFFRGTIDGSVCLITHYASPRGILVSVYPFNEILNKSNVTGTTTVLLLFLFAIAAAALFIGQLTRALTAPLESLAESMRRVEHGELGIEIENVRDDEIGILTNQFNKMSRHIRTLINEVYEIKLAKKEAEFKALQAQINPHFLYNTLDAVYWLAKIEMAPKTAKSVYALSMFFKLGLNGGQTVSTVRTEVEYLKNYLEILSIRYDTPLDVAIDIDPELMNCISTHLMLQPIVENAIIHGIAESNRPGRIIVKGEKKRKNIVIAVSDNGIGMSKERCRTVLKTNVSRDRSFGIRNVHESIKLLFGNTYGLTIRSEPEKGTTVFIQFPYMLTLPEEKEL